MFTLHCPRLTALQKLGLYDLFEDKLLVGTSNTSATTADQSGTGYTKLLQFKLSRLFK